MKITVLNGSPKGYVSITMQYVRFIQKKFPQHELNILNISHEIKKIERDDNAFQKIIDDVKSSDGVLWAFPVYAFLVPSQYKRFIELIGEKGAEETFKNKYAATLSTSARVFDHTAHIYMNAICDDLDMKFVDFYSADYDDLRKEEERNRLIQFAGYFFESIEKTYSTYTQFKPLASSSFEYIPGRMENSVDTGGKKIIRDLAWGRVRFVFPDDHKYHKKHGWYDFPYKDFRVIAMNLMMVPLTKIPAFRKEMTRRMTKEMIKPFEKIVRTK